MKLKMALLEQAHGLLCNAPGAGHGARTDPEAVAEWERLRAQWIDQWGHLIRAQQVKEHNCRVSIGNEAIEGYQESERAAERAVREVAAAVGDDVPDDWAIPAGRVRVHPDASGTLCWPNGIPLGRNVAVIWHNLSRISAPSEDYMAAQAAQ